MRTDLQLVFSFRRGHKVHQSNPSGHEPLLHHTSQVDVDCTRYVAGSVGQHRPAVEKEQRPLREEGGREEGRKEAGRKEGGREGREGKREERIKRRRGKRWMEEGREGRKK